MSNYDSILKTNYYEEAIDKLLYQDRVFEEEITTAIFEPIARLTDSGNNINLTDNETFAKLTSEGTERALRVKKQLITGQIKL